MKRLSVNCDDFGLSPGVNDGVKQAFQAGVLSDASLMLNGPACSEALDISRETGLPLALHLNLIRGRMLSPATILPCSVPKLWSGWLLSAKLRLQAEVELRRQIERALELGVNPVQLNAEKHFHFFPPVFRLFVRLAAEYRVPGLRFINEWYLLPHSIQKIKADLLSLFALANRAAARSAGLLPTANFRGIALTGGLDRSRLVKLLSRLPEGWTELMVHLSATDDLPSEMGGTFLHHSRLIELQALLAPETRQALKEHGVRLLSLGGKHD